MTTPGPRSVVVTGVSRPGQLGDAIARGFAAAGDQVVLVARRADDAVACADAMTAIGHRPLAFGCDLADPEAVRDLATRITAATGRIDAVIHAAGGFASSGPVAASDPAAWNAQLTTNLHTAYAVARGFLPALRERHGSITFIASQAALPCARVAGVSAYAVAKGGVLALMRAIAQEEREHQVRANAVAPGTLRTGANTKAVPSATPMVDLESVVQAVRFLAGADARQVTGQLIELAP
jgi:NAD(P)-dependent dehydrogenase (short-subunit alcohol dehydrogenase family)